MSGETKSKAQRIAELRERLARGEAPPNEERRCPQHNEVLGVFGCTACNVIARVRKTRHSRYDGGKIDLNFD